MIFILFSLFETALAKQGSGTKEILVFISLNENKRKIYKIILYFVPLPSY